ncbi:hypothetical protein EDD16DRAFT_1806916 [Pisolithus croceorrhizus]|nr:hypothetical protein EDD16DRAFT_1806916 [Pisolithus croceorrhizus]KAI6125533.1 hypothetical protein EV401DRAFT_1855856 [Pisolithus croceorrhizus]
MAGGSPTAFLLWSILACLFYCFLIFHLWNYDRFKCVRWSQGDRRPGAFKRVMTYTYIATLTLLVIFGAAFTFLKFKEGIFVVIRYHAAALLVIWKPLELYSPAHKKWVLPLLFALSVAWACELPLKELTFWLFLQNQGPRSRVWFDSWEFKLWLWGSMVAILGMPTTTLVARKQLDTCLAWILFVGSTASTCETLGFLFVLFRFPAFIRKVKDDGAAPNIIVRLVYSYQLNCGRIAFRFVFSIPLLVLGIDGAQGSHPINMSPCIAFCSNKPVDFLLMLGAVGSFVSSGITLLVFFPRSLISELGYNITSPITPVAAKTSTVPHAEFQQTSGPRPEPLLAEKRTPSFLQRPPRSSTDSEQEASPDYDPESLANASRPQSYDGHIPTRVWDSNGVPTPCTDESPSPARYIFDHRSKCLVRPHSDGHSLGLDPYVRFILYFALATFSPYSLKIRRFRSPIGE